MKTLASTLALFLLVLPAVAQDNIDPANTADLGPPLTKAKAESFVACLGDIIEIGKKYDGDDAPALTGHLTDDDFGASIAAMSAHPAYKEISAALEKHGFEDPEEWAQTSQRFLSAYSALKLEEQDTDINAQMKKAIDQIRENTMLTDEQKDQMIDMMKAQQQLFDDFQGDTSDADKEAVKAVMEEFEELNSEQ